MPRKYHRPPAAKRRKSKKTAPYVFEGAPEPEDGEAAELIASPEELDEDDWTREAGATRATETGRSARGRAPVGHIVKDFSYVRTEIVRILALAAFLIVSLLITAVLRN